MPCQGWGEKVMHAQTVLPVAVRAVTSSDLDARLASVRDRTRRRAYELFCRRGSRKGDMLDDWAVAERESNLVPLAGVTEEESEIRINACVPDVNASDLTVEVLPNEIVVESNCNGEIRRCTRFHLPVRIQPRRVQAQLCDNELDIVAPKAATSK